MSYEIIYHPIVANEDIPSLPKTVKDRIKKAIEERLVTHPESFGKPLKYSLTSLRSLRVGDYRAVYSIEETKVLILRITHRRDAYKK